MDSIDDVTLQFLANKQHYQRYLDKNQASETIARELSQYGDRFLELTRQLVRHHASGPHASGPHASGPHASGPHASGPHASGPHASGSISSESSESSDEASSTLSTIQEESELPESLHKDVHDAFGRYVESIAAYFRFVDRNEAQEGHAGTATFVGFDACDEADASTLDSFVTKTLLYHGASAGAGNPNGASISVKKGAGGVDEEKEEKGENGEKGEKGEARQKRPKREARSKSK